MSQKLYRPMIAGAALAVSSLFFAGAAAAQSAPDAPAASTESAKRGAEHGKPGADSAKRGHHHFKAMRDGIMVPGVGPLPKRVVDDLKLTEAQRQQLEQARAGQRELGRAMREGGKSHRQAVAKQLEAGQLDPRALLTQREADKGKVEAGMKAQRDRWLSLWDSLDATQQAKVADHLKAREAKRAKMREARAA